MARRLIFKEGGLTGSIPSGYQAIGFNGATFSQLTSGGLFTSGGSGASGTSGVNGTSGANGASGTAGTSGTSSGGGGGKFGIADSTGTYTYYSTLTLAMTGATAGQTIEMFTDYTESSSVTITLKNGVNINGNGHTYNYTAATGNCFIDNSVAVTCSIQNLIVNRTSHTSGSVWVISSGSSNIDFLGSKTYITSASGTDYTAYITGAASNLWVKATGSSIHAIQGSSGYPLLNCYGETTGSGRGIYVLYPNIQNCIGISVSGEGILAYENGSPIINCIGKSTSNYGIRLETSGNDQRLINSIAISSSGMGVRLQGAKMFNSMAISSSSVAISCGFGTNQVNNTVCRSSSNIALGCAIGDIINNSTIISDGSVCISGGGSIRNSSIINNWNNAGGHGYSTPASGTDICNNFIFVTNASANCIYSASAVTMKYANNSFKGATTSVNANITQGISNTQDSQGNITL